MYFYVLTLNFIIYYISFNNICEWFYIILPGGFLAFSGGPIGLRISNHIIHIALVQSRMSRILKAIHAFWQKSEIASVSHPPNIRKESFRWKEIHERRLLPSVHLFQLLEVSQAPKKHRVLPVGPHRCPIEPGGQPVVIPAVPNQNSLIQQFLVQFPVPGLKENVIGIGREYSEP